MRCAWNQLMSVVPLSLREEVDRQKEDLQELRLRLTRPAELVSASGRRWGKNTVTEQDLRFVVNTASRYSPWTADTASMGYITAPGGHRIGLCGQVIRMDGQVSGIKKPTSVNIRVARDFEGLSAGIPVDENILILGPPGSGKTTLLRDFIRRISAEHTVATVDERGELFPEDFDCGLRTDVLTGCRKIEGIGMVLRTMNPEWIAVDEITSDQDCLALRSALWCGVRLMATAHAGSREDLLRRDVYRPIVDSGCFDLLVVMRPDKSWHLERVNV